MRRRSERVAVPVAVLLPPGPGVLSGPAAGRALGCRHLMPPTGCSPRRPRRPTATAPPSRRVGQLEGPHRALRRSSRVPAVANPRQPIPREFPLSGTTTRCVDDDPMLITEDRDDVAVL